MNDEVYKARSNYFLVKNKRAFKKFVQSVEGLSCKERHDGAMVLFSEERGWRSLYDKDGNPLDDLPDRVAAHLRDGEVAIFLEICAEGMNILFGKAVAVNSKGECVSVSLGDIYTLAKQLGTNFSLAED
jgi:hypothetical protein